MYTPLIFHLSSSIFTYSTFSCLLTLIVKKVTPLLPLPPHDERLDPPRLNTRFTELVTMVIIAIIFLCVCLHVCV